LFYVGKDCPYYDWPVDGEEHRITEVVVNRFTGELTGIFGPFNELYTAIDDVSESEWRNDHTKVGV